MHFRSFRRSERSPASSVAGGSTPCVGSPRGRTCGARRTSSGLATAARRRGRITTAPRRPRAARLGRGVDVPAVSRWQRSPLALSPSLHDRTANLEASGGFGGGGGWCGRMRGDANPHLRDAPRSAPGLLSGLRLPVPPRQRTLDNAGGARLATWRSAAAPRSRAPSPRRGWPPGSPRTRPPRSPARRSRRRSGTPLGG